MRNNRVAELRKARGWSMAQLGARCVPPVTASQINKIEKGGTGISPKWMRVLSRAFECNPLEILPCDLRAAVLNFRDALDAAEPPGTDTTDPIDEPDQPSAEEWEILRRYRAADDTMRQMLRVALAAQEPPLTWPTPRKGRAIFEFEVEQDGAYRWKAFWPPEKSRP